MYSSGLSFAALDAGGMTGKENHTAVSRTICQGHWVLYYIGPDDEIEADLRNVEFSPKFQKRGSSDHNFGVKWSLQKVFFCF